MFSYLLPIFCQKVYNDWLIFYHSGWNAPLGNQSASEMLHLEGVMPLPVLRRELWVIKTVRHPNLQNKLATCKWGTCFVFTLSDSDVLNIKLGAKDIIHAPYRKENIKTYLGTPAMGHTNTWKSHTNVLVSNQKKEERSHLRENCPVPAFFLIRIKTKYSRQNI